MNALTKLGQETVAKRLSKRGDIVLALVVVAILALFILPLPIFVIDMMIAASIASGVMLLALAMYAPTALSFSTFPSLLLFSTIFRLSLSIASIKLILLHAHAGHIIEAFGNLVVAGSVAVGLVIFVVIALVQFLVISKGSERVAEVSARFTLDAMPGKQMSIDADLRAGSIDREQARSRRLMLERESQMHGAMDGAMKFVKNDAIATLIVAFVNIVAGIGIGVGMRGMEFMDALSRYTLLTVGDAMVAQVPSLLTSLAAGVLITRVSTSDQPTRLGQQIGEQILEQPAALAVGSCVMAAFCLVPGFPKVPFMVVTFATGALAFYLHRAGRSSNDIRQANSESMGREGLAKVLPMIEREMSNAASPLRLRVCEDDALRIQPTAFNNEIHDKRTKLKLELGLPFPGLTIQIDATIEKGAYCVDIQEICVERAQLPNEKDADSTLERFLADRLFALVTHRADAFVGMQEVQSMLVRASSVIPDLVVELQKACPLQRTSEVLRRLAQEGVSLRHQREIFESLATWAPREKDIVMLVERVRVDLGRLVVHRYAEGQVLRAFLLDGAAEKCIREAVQPGLGGGVLALAPDNARALTASADQIFAATRVEGRPILLTSMEVRRYALKLYAARVPGLVALSFQELPADMSVQVLGRFAAAPAAIKRVA